MPVPEATALIEHASRHISQPDHPLARPSVWLHRPAVDRQALVALVAWGEAFSPLVGLDEQPSPAGLLLDVTGIAARHGGEEKLAQHLRTQLRQRGYWGQLGLADTLGAAWALAHFGHLSSAAQPQSQCNIRNKRPRGARRWIYIAPPGATRQALGPLPVAALRLSDGALEWLRQLGVERIEQLWELPRAGVCSRLGDEVLQRQDQALNQCAEILVAHQLQQPFVAQWQAEHPTDRYATIRQVVEHLSQHLAELLASQQQGALQLRCRLHCEGSPVQLDVNLFQPTPQADYLWQLLQTQLESICLPGPVTAIELLALTTAPLRQQQPRLWGIEPTATDAQHLASLIDSISNRLGWQQVCTARLRAGPLPETTYELIPLVGPEASSARLSAGLQRTPPVPGHRPLHLLHPPVPIQMISQSPQGSPLRFVIAGSPEQVQRSWGPERIETAWWQGPSVRRDYYRVQCASGARFWLFCNLHDRQWLLHGEFI
jgi:protein ImuB